MNQNRNDLVAAAAIRLEKANGDAAGAAMTRCTGWPREPDSTKIECTSCDKRTVAPSGCFA